MKEMTFICPPHMGHFRASMSQTFFRRTAHCCLLHLEYEERLCDEVESSTAAAFGKIPWRRSLPLHAWLQVP